MFARRVNSLKTICRVLKIVLYLVMKSALGVGTLYKQVSSFEAKKIGAVLVGRNIASMLRRIFSTSHGNGVRSSFVGAGGNAAERLVT
jgi:hypothetical protein